MTSKTRRREFKPAQTRAYRKAAREAAGWTRESRLARTSGHGPDGTEGPAQPRRARPPSPKTAIVKLDLSNPRIEARQELVAGQTFRAVLLHDQGGTQSVPGLRIRLGARSATWIFY